MKEEEERERPLPQPERVADTVEEPERLIAEYDTLFTPLQVAIGTVLGGVVGTAVMVASNFKRLGRPRVAALSLLLGLLLAPFVSFGQLLALNRVLQTWSTAEDRGAIASIWGFGALLAYLLTKVLQGAALGEPRQGRSWAVVLLLVPLAWAVTAVVLAVVVLALVSFDGRS